MELIYPTWPAPANVCAVSTTRHGGVSQSPFMSLNLGTHVGDHFEDVIHNRAQLSAVLELRNPPIWLNQVHGTQVAVLSALNQSSPLHSNTSVHSFQHMDADAVFTRERDQVCAVMTADCLPVLFCDKKGQAVAAAHAGWRGLLNGVLENTLSYFSDPQAVMAWLGPAIGPNAFEVGDEVKAAFEADHPATAKAFQYYQQGKWLADIYLLASIRLKNAGVTDIYGGEYCTMTDSNRFFSYRRTARTGRQASLIWITSASSI